MALMENAQSVQELNTEFTAEIINEINKVKDKISQAYKYKSFKSENFKNIAVDTY